MTVNHYPQDETLRPVNYVQEVTVRFGDMELPNELVNLYSLLVFTKGVNCTLEDVHNAWSLWRSTLTPGHHSIVPFDQLPHDVQELDRMYRDRIVEIASDIFSGH